MRKIAVTFVLLVSSVLMAPAQDVRDVTLSPAMPYDESVAVSCDEKGLALNVRITYDEDNDILSLSLVPDRPVIFYRQDVIYKDVFPSGKTLRTEKFPYPVQIPPASTFKLLKTVYKSYPGNRKCHVYNRWLGNVSSGLTELSPMITESGGAVPFVTSDSLFLRFRVDPSVSKVSFRIRNVQTVDLLKKKKSGKSCYSITGEADLNISYRIAIQRNPCHGMSALKTSVDNRIREVSRAYSNLHQACPDGIALSEEEAAIFNEHRKFLESQFPVLDIDTECQDVLSSVGAYNAYVDSIRSAPCDYVPRNEKADDFIEGDARVSSVMLVGISRKLNSMAVRMLTAGDPMERRDLYFQAERLIEEIQNQISENGVSGDDREQAMKLFIGAVDFWHRIVSKIHF